MNLSRSTLALVALNAAWLAVATYFLGQRFRDGASEPEVRYITNHVPIAPSSMRTAAAPPADSGPAGFQWAQLESEDYRTYIERLRSIGCPEQTIRDIVIADIDKLLAPKLQAASRLPKEFSYWQPVEQELWNDPEQRDALRQQRAVDFEKREVIRELLGVDLVGERLKVQGQDDYHGARLSFLPDEKRARVRLVLDHYSDEEQALLEQQFESDAPAAGADLQQLQEQRRAEIAQLLSPDELERFDLWFSPTASRVRDSIYGMNATEEEFLKIYQLRREFELQQAGVESGGGEELEARLRQALGDERYTDFVRSRDPDFRELFAVTSRFKLPRAVALELYSYKEIVQEHRTQLDADPHLTLEQKLAALEAIASETQQAVREAVGEKAFRQLMRRGGNRWMRGN